MSYQLARFENVIRNHRITGPDERILMDREGKLSVYFIPFDYVNTKAKAVLVGITPGPSQMKDALPVAHDALRKGDSIERATIAAKNSGAFAGAMRTNLLRQLDHWGVDEWLGINGSAALFGSQRDLVQTTSLLRFPVFNGDREYNGSSDMTSKPLLLKYLREYFVPEANLLKDAAFFPLGPVAWKVMKWLHQRGEISPAHVFYGLLHPSGNNQGRFKYIFDRSVNFPHSTKAETIAAYDNGRLHFRKVMLGK